MSAQGVGDYPDERTALLSAQQGLGPRPSDQGDDLRRTISSTSTVQNVYRVPWKQNIVLLLAVFLVNSDSAILMSIFRHIAQEFDALPSSSWIINSYLVGLLVSQPLYGKLSDIFGRKPVLLIAYSFYCVGGLLGGLGFSFWSVLIGRAIAGIGNAGITVLISTLIVDLVPLEDVALWRGFVYAVNQIGRAAGPSLGGLITDYWNWRWALLYPMPLNVLCLIFIWWRMSFPPVNDDNIDPNEQGETWSKLRRVDMSGAVSLAIANCSLLLFLDEAQRGMDVAKHVTTIVPGILWISSFGVFLLVEAFWAKEPIFPLHLMAKRNVFSSYAIQLLQTAAQMALFTSVPLYFRVTNGDSHTSIAIRLLFITGGTILGGLISGFSIKRSRKYRLIIWVSIAFSNFSFLAIFLRWRGHTGWLETMYGFPVGLGFGVSLSAAYIALTARLDSSKVAVSTSGFYLSLNLGSLVGVSVASLLIQSSVRQQLRETLRDFPNRDQLMDKILSNLDIIHKVPPKLREIIVEAYCNSLIHVWVFALLCGCLAFVVSLFMREAPLVIDQYPELKHARRRGAV